MVQARTHPSQRPPDNDRDGVLPPTLTQLLIRWGSSFMVVAIVISLFLHVSGGVVASMIEFRGQLGGKGGTSGQPVEMAIGAAGPLGDIEEMAAGGAMPAVPTEVASGEANSALTTPGVDSPGVDDSSLDANADGLGGLAGSLAGGGDISLSGGAMGGGSGGGGGGNGAAFFGVEVSGTRFAFIVDVSSSMEADNRIVRLKQELRASIDGLAETAEFMVTTFSDESQVLGGKIEWRKAVPAARRRLFGEVEAIVLGPSTNPMPAFESTFQLRPRPDAIYFMTDGEFDEVVVERVAILNRAGGNVPIHCICFGNDAGGKLLQRIAAQSKGTYTYVASN